MIKTLTSRISLLAPLALSVAACGGGGGAGGSGGDDTFVSRSPIANVEMAAIENRTGITKRQPQAVENAVAIINNIDGHANARLVIRDTQLLNDDSIRDAAIYMQIDQNGDGIYDGNEDWASDPLNLNPDGNPISPTTGQPIIITDTMSYGGANMAMAEHVPDFRSRTTVYVPADAASDMYGGMFVTSRDGGEHFRNASGSVVTWGRNITAGEAADVKSVELNAQDGKAEYSGVAEAIVSNAAANESGRYRDHAANGVIDFNQNSVTTTANMTGVENTGSSMSVQTSMAYNDDGTINQGVTYIDGLSVGRMMGTSTGEVYGSNADTLGVVFTGTDGGEADVVGGMLLNRTDD